MKLKLLLLLILCFSFAHAQKKCWIKKGSSWLWKNSQTYALRGLTGPVYRNDAKFKIISVDDPNRVIYLDKI